MNIGQLMSRNPRTCGANDSLSVAARIMWENDCGCVPVVDADGRAIAMITDRDICMAAYTQGKPLTDIPVSAASSRRLVTVHESDEIVMAEALMGKHQIRRLPVVDDQGHPVGILSLNDLTRRAGHHRDIDVDGVVRTMAAVCEPTALSAAAE